MCTTLDFDYLGTGGAKCKVCLAVHVSKHVIVHTVCRTRGVCEAERAYVTFGMNTHVCRELSHTHLHDIA